MKESMDEVKKEFQAKLLYWNNLKSKSRVHCLIYRDYSVKSVHHSVNV